MAEKNPADEILKQFAELLALAEQKAGRPIDIKNEQAILQQLEQMEAALNETRKLVDEEISQAGISEKTMQEGIIRMPPGLTQKQQQWWKKMNRLWWNAHGLRYAFKKAVSDIQLEKKGKNEPTTQKEKRKSMKARQDRLRGVGGKKNWNRI